MRLPAARAVYAAALFIRQDAACVRLYSRWAHNTPIHARTRQSPLSLSLSSSIAVSSHSPSQSVPSSSSSRSLFLLHSLTTHGADLTRSRERDVSAALRVSPRSRRRFRRNKPRSMGRLVGYDPGYMMVARRARRGMP